MNPIAKLRFAIDYARLSPLVKIRDFDSSPRRADSPGSSKRCLFVGKATEKTDLYF